MSAKKRFTVKGCIGKIFYSPKEWEVDRETAFYYRIVNRNTGKKKWLGKEYFMQKRQIIPIVRANEILIARLLDAGILYIGEDNVIHVTED